jgi:NAD(P)-dependent dehydrogenase (short-subunit alcohol dehydrogenase family)
VAWSVGSGLEGRGVIVTGAAGGIGRAVTEAFAATGARVMAVDLRQEAVDEVEAGMEGTGHVGVAADLADLAGHNTPMLMTGLAPEVYETMKKQTPLGYVAEPEELAGPVVFLASDHAKYITGATLNVSGGFLMH